MSLDPSFLSVVALAVIILGLSKGGFAGVGMLSTPLVAVVSDPLTAAGLMLPVMMVQDPVAVWMYRKSFDAGLLRAMLPGAAFGVAGAWVFASVVPVWGVQLGLGLISVVFSLWQLLLLRRGKLSEGQSGRRAVRGASLAGLASGFTSAIAHAGSPPFQIYVTAQQLSKETYVGTSVMFFAAVNMMKLPSFAALGLFRADLLPISALFVPLAVGSSWLGVRLVRRVDLRGFNLAITLILLAVGILLLAQGVGGKKG